MLTVYSLPTCGWCDKLKDYLKSKGAEYMVIDVSESKQNLIKLREVSGQSAVPVTVSEDGEVVIGFDQKQIDKLLQ